MRIGLILAIFTMVLFMIVCTTSTDVHAINEEDLFKAVKKGSIEDVQLCLANEVDVNAKDEAGLTPLTWAAFYGYTNVAELLIANKANINDTDYLALCIAAREGHKEFVRLLLANNADVNPKDNRNNPLVEAVDRGYIEIASLLLDNNADVNAEDGKKMTALAAAVPRRFSSRMIELLLAYKADVNQRYGYGLSLTPIGLAAFCGRIEEARLLLASKADLNMKTRDGYAPMHTSSSIEMLELLIENDADVNAVNGKNETLLHEAVEEGRTEIVALLLRHHADRTLRNKEGKTALEMIPEAGSRCTNYIQIKELLTSALTLS